MKNRKPLIPPASRNTKDPRSESMDVDRRDFLRLMGLASLGAATTSGCGLNYQPINETRDNEWKNLEEKIVLTACTLCPGGCGLKARVVDGIAVKVEGNPNHPVSRGGLCPTGASAIQFLYHPERIKKPMKRLGNRGEGKWEEISWEAAFAELTSRLSETRNGGAHRLAVIDGSHPEGLLSRLWKRFCQAYGTPNYLSLNNRLPITAFTLTQGAEKPVGYDWENANCILSFGHTWLDGGDSPVRSHRAYGYLRQGREGLKAKIIHIEPRMSVSAAMADEWVPIRPGTEASLALGIAYIILKDELYPKDFIENQTFGFESWKDRHGTRHEGFRKHVLSNYRPESVASQTGVSVSTIVRIAKEFAATRSAIAVPGASALLNSNGTFTGMAIHALNALVGSLDVPGGVRYLRDLPLAGWPDLEADAAAKKGLDKERLDGAGSSDFPFAPHVVDNLPEVFAKGDPYRPKMLIMSEANPFFLSADPLRFENSLSDIPYIVSLSSLIDESAKWADLILPASNALERWQDAPAPVSTGLEIWSIAKPVVPALGESRHPGDVLLTMAASLGGPVAGAFPWDGFEDVLKKSARGLFDSHRGLVFSDTFEEEEIRNLEARGWWLSAHDTFDSFWKKLLERGGWWDPYYPTHGWGRIFNTPSGRFEFFSQILKSRLEANAKKHHEGSLAWMLESLDIQASGDEVFLPHFEAPRISGEPKAYPSIAYPADILPLLGGKGAEVGLIQEILGPHVHMRWGSWVEINPSRAKEWGLNDGDLVRVESPNHNGLYKAKLFAGVMPECICLPMGLGRRAGADSINGRGANPLELLSVTYDRLSGAASRYSVRVKIYKA